MAGGRKGGKYVRPPSENEGGMNDTLVVSILMVVGFAAVFYFKREALKDGTRRAYEKFNPFDDSIPGETVPAEKFYTAFGPVFERNNKFSLDPALPSLGDADTPIKEIKKFYDSWFRFRSGREFTAQDIDAEETDPSMEKAERRGIDRANLRRLELRQKREADRLRRLVERAQKNDPRLLKEREEELAAQEAIKAQREAARKEVAERKAQEKREAAEKEQKENETAAKALRAARQKQRQEVGEGGKTGEETKKAGASWGEDDLASLTKAIAKYPGGTVDRWRRIGSMLPASRNYSEEDILQKVKEIESDWRNSGNVSVMATAGGSGGGDESGGVEDWSPNQQQQLEEGLREQEENKGKDKFLQVAARVEGKTAKQCFDRYKYLCALK